MLVFAAMRYVCTPCTLSQWRIGYTYPSTGQTPYSRWKSGSPSQVRLPSDPLQAKVWGGFFCATNFPVRGTKKGALSLRICALFTTSGPVGQFDAADNTTLSRVPDYDIPILFCYALAHVGIPHCAPEGMTARLNSIAAPQGMTRLHIEVPGVGHDFLIVSIEHAYQSYTLFDLTQAAQRFPTFPGCLQSSQVGRLVWYVTNYQRYTTPGARAYFQGQYAGTVPPMALCAGYVGNTSF